MVGKSSSPKRSHSRACDSCRKQCLPSATAMRSSSPHFDSPSKHTDEISYGRKLCISHTIFNKDDSSDRNGDDRREVGLSILYGRITISCNAFLCTISYSFAGLIAKKTFQTKRQQSAPINLADPRGRHLEKRCTRVVRTMLSSHAVVKLSCTWISHLVA